MRRSLVRVALAAVLVACSDPDVRSESAQEITAGSATTEPEQPPSTTAEPTTTAAPTTTPAPTTTEALANENAGDSLYPELGTDDLDVQSYDVRLGYDPATGSIDGAVTVTALAVGALERLVLDADGLAIESITVDGTPAEFQLGDREVQIRPPAPVAADQQVVVDVTYGAEASQSPPGLGVGWYRTANGSVVLNQPAAARTWMPANDHPSDKATWRFEITVPAGTTAVANGQLVEQRPGSDGDTWVWEQREPMATYLVQLLTGDYEVLDAGLVGSVPIVNAALAEDVERMTPYFELTDDQLAFFEPLFGPYPLDRYGLAFTDSFPGLAMETQGRSLFSRDDFPGGTPGIGEHVLTAHELAHAWFGNAVSPADWGDLWLSESFASYAEWLWFEDLGFFRLEAHAQRMLQSSQDFLEPTGLPTVENLFGYERYYGGAVVVHALRRELGDELFFPLLQRWVAENDGTSRTTEDFIALANEVAGRDLTPFFDAWLYAADLPDAYPG